MVIFAACGSFILYFGCHLLGHRRRGTAHFRAKTLKAFNEDLNQNDLVWAGGEESDFHDTFLAEDERKKISGKVPDLITRLSPPPIPISGSLLSLDDVPEESILSKAWKEALSSLPIAAEATYSKWFQDTESPVAVTTGIPGTKVDTEEKALALQNYLDCFSSEGSWIYDPRGNYLANFSAGLTVHKQSAVFASCDKAFYGRKTSKSPAGVWDVRSSLKWRWEPSSACQPPVILQKRITTVQAPPSRQELCHYLRHKHILMVGNSPTQYLLHDLLLDWTSERSLTCYGDLYCKEHGICGDGLADGKANGRSWAGDTRTFDTLPDPPAISSQSSVRERSESGETQAAQISGYEISEGASGEHTWGTILRYRRSDSLFLNASPSHPRHQPGYIHPDTGIRDINMYSIPDSRRSDVVIISKAPIPVPLSSNKLSSRCRRLARMTAELEKDSWLGETKALKALEMAVALTKEIWLPELMESLRSLKAAPSPPDNLVIYRGGWRMQPECATSGSSSHDKDASFDWTPSWKFSGDGPPPHLTPPKLGTLFFPLGMGGMATNRSLTDMRSLIYNIQTILQNHIIRRYILPKLGIVYLDLESPTSIWRSGFVGGASVTKAPVSKKSQIPLDVSSMQDPENSGDCLRMCLPSPGLALEEFFIGSLLRLFAHGWGGDGENVWTGKNYIPVRQRTKDRIHSHSSNM